MIVLLIFITIALLANTLFIKPVYNITKKKALVSTAKYIDLLNGEYEENIRGINEREEHLSARIIIYDDEEIIYLSMGRIIKGEMFNDFGAQRGKGGASQQNYAPKISEMIIETIPKIINKSETEKIDDSTNITTLTAMDKSQYLYLDTVLSDGTVMNIVVEMQSLGEAVRIFNMFLVISAFICMLIATIITYFMSRKFVSPIQNMNEVTKKIANLNFSSQVEVKTEDELKQLGDNINLLSNNLEGTIAELTQELEKARRLEKLRKNFVSTVSHELKTPISLLQGYAVGLTSDVCDRKEKRDYYASVIADESENLGALVNELMDLTQLEAGYMTLRKEEFELGEYLDSIIKKYKAANPKINFEYIKPTDNVAVSGDVKLTERVISNYLSNAVRHVDSNNNIEISLHEKEGYIEVSVFNSGKHINDDSIDEIWNSFYRADDTGSRKMGGHGLGLAIVKNIQMAHGMDYGVQNVNGGVRFWFGMKKSDQT